MARKFQKGFTLIELLVVVAIISLLSSVVLASLNSARAKVRDTKRFAELRQLQTAMELYRANNTMYPLSSGHKVSLSDCRSAGVADWNDSAYLGQLVSGGYIKSLPVDPINSASKNLCYTYINFERDDDNVTAWTCKKDGVVVFDPDGFNSSDIKTGTKYPYLITFTTEINNLSLPLFDSTTKTYCLLGPGA